MTDAGYYFWIQNLTGSPATRTITMPATEVTMGMSPNSGLTIAFALSITVTSVPVMHQQSIEFTIKGMSDNGHAWGYKYRMTLSNRGVSPFYRAATEELTTQHQHAYAYNSWKIDSYAYVFDPKNNRPQPEREFYANKLNMYHKTVRTANNTDASSLIENNQFLLCESDDTLFDTNVGHGITDISIDNYQYYWFDMHLGNDEDTYFAINGARTKAVYGLKDENTLPAFLQVGGTKHIVDMTISFLDMPATPLSFRMSNIWVSLQELTSSQMTEFRNRIYNIATGKPQDLGNGHLLLAGPKKLEPLFYSVGHLFNATNGKPITVTDGITRGPSVYTTKREGRFDQFIHRCRRMEGPVPNEYYDDSKLAATGERGWAKHIAHFLDWAPASDWSKIYMNCYVGGPLRITILCQADPDKSKHIAYQLLAYPASMPSRDVFLRVFVQYIGQPSPNTIHSGTYSRPGNLLHYWGLYIDSANLASARLSFSNSGNALDMSTSTISLSGRFPQYKKANVVIIEMLERRWPDDTDAGLYSTRFHSGQIFNKSNMDRDPTVAWDRPEEIFMGLHQQNASGGVPLWAPKDPGPDGSDIIGQTPKLFITPMNGLGAFVNAATNNLCISSGYQDTNHSYQDLTIAPFIERKEIGWTPEHRLSED